MTYKLLKHPITSQIREDMILKTDENGREWYVPNDPANQDWKQYQGWLEAGNQPDPADD